MESLFKSWCHLTVTPENNWVKHWKKKAGMLKGCLNLDKWAQNQEEFLTLMQENCQRTSNILNCHSGPQSRTRWMKIVQRQDDLVKGAINRNAKWKLNLTTALRPNPWNERIGLISKRALSSNHKMKVKILQSALHFSNIAKNANNAKLTKIGNVHASGVNTRGWTKFDEIGKRSPKLPILPTLSIVELFRQIYHFCHRVHFWT